MKTLPAFAGLILLAGPLGVIAVGCGSEKSPSAAPAPPTSRTEQPAATPKSSPPKLDGDGRYFGFIEAAKADPPTISFDVAQKFSGEAANRAAAEDGFVSPGEPVPNDYYVRNSHKQAELLRLAKDVQLTAAVPVTRLSLPAETRKRCRSGCTEGIPVTLTDFFASFTTKRAPGAANGGPFWVTIKDGLVVMIDEQYFP
jgi:hypothetical protein